MDKSETTDMSGIWDNWVETMTLGTIEVKLPRIGAYVWYQGKQYQILSTTTYQEQSTILGTPPETPRIGTIATILQVTDEGDDAGEPSIKVKVEELRQI